jgi:hypothetical protein
MRDLIDISGVAAMLEVDRSQALQFSEELGFPQPAAHNTAHHMWERESVRAWFDSTGYATARRNLQEWLKEPGP